jgi:dipeptidyl-peptidase-4
MKRIAPPRPEHPSRTHAHALTHASAALLVGSLSIVYPAGAAESDTRADYERAEKLLPFNFVGKVLNATVSPHWIDGGARFWYRRDTAAGTRLVLIDSATGRELPLTDAVRATAESSPADEQGDTHELLISPDGRRAVLGCGLDLCVKDMPAGTPRRITTDGEAHFAYGKGPDLTYRTLRNRREGVRKPPADVAWAPDSRRLVLKRVDEREIAPYPFLESSPVDGSARPVVHDLRIPLPGDRHQAKSQRMILDVDSGPRKTFVLPDGGEFYLDGAAWSSDGRLHYSFGVNVDRRNEASLFELDLETAALRTLIKERNDSFILLNNDAFHGPNVLILPRSGEIIWFSEQDGWGHLYLHDLRSGRLKNRITRGSWLVRDIVHVDEARRLVYFTGGGREAGRNPYFQHLYRIGFDGKGLRLLTPEDGDHEITPEGDGASISPDGRYVVDTWSTVDRPPISVLRHTDGRLIAELEKADASALYAMGWKPPERFTAKAADGTTDLYGVLYRPAPFDPGRKYPVIEHIYGGPLASITPHNFMQAVMDGKALASTAALGFVTLAMDARGTVKRSKTFQDALYKKFGDWMIGDHVAVIQQLAAQRRYMDLDRVGVEGHSFGGYGAARAILARPDFYKVSVASAGTHNLQGMFSYEEYMGPPIYGDGSSINPGNGEIPVNYREADNGLLADRLRGKLMLVYGDLDEAAHPAVTLQLADSLIKANKSFDLLYLPSRFHNFSHTDFYFVRRKWDYFVEHLAGRRPPENYEIRPTDRRLWGGEIQW